MVEQEVISKYKTNPHLEGTRDEFLEKNMRLVYSVVSRRFKSVINSDNSYDTEDLNSIGMIGLIKAYEKFDPTKFEQQPKFSTYAVPLIEGEIKRALRDNTDNGIRVGRNSKDVGYKIRRSEKEYTSVEEVMEDFEVSRTIAKEGIEFAMNLTKANSFDAVAGNRDDTDLTLEDTIGKDPMYDTRLELLNVLDLFNPKERALINLFFVEDLSQREAGEKLGVSQVHVSRMLKKIILKGTEFNKVREESNMGKGFEKAMKLLKETDKTISEISKETGISLATVDYHAREIRDGEKINKEPKVEAPKKKKNKKEDKSSPVTIIQKATVKEESKVEEPILTPEAVEIIRESGATFTEVEENEEIQWEQKTKTIINVEKTGQELTVEELSGEFNGIMDALKGINGKIKLKLKLKIEA